MAGSFADVTVAWRHNGTEYSGIGSTLERQNRPGAMANVEGAVGAVRVIVDDLKEPLPESGDDIEVRSGTGVWEPRSVLLLRYDQARATVRIDYGQRG